MRLLASLTVLLSIAPWASAAPFKLALTTVTGKKQPDSYIVKLKDGSKKEDLLVWLTPYLDSGDAGLTFEYDSSPEIFTAFSGHFSPKVLDALRSSPHVEYISEDAVFSFSAVQTSAPWGLQRIAQPGKLLSDNPLGAFTYQHDPTWGLGVDVFVLDSGIYVNHPDFEGRASWGYSAFGGVPDDDHGHGTHVAGTIGSLSFGVAKKANLIAVKVGDALGNTPVSMIMAGLDYVVKQCKGTTRKCVINMSLGEPANLILDQGTTAAIAAGIHVIAAAGNDAIDVKLFSPARVPSVITVGASNINDTMAFFSNYGPIVDIFAPGVNIVSTWLGFPGAINAISGTSMAAPHVSGIAAALLSTYGPQTPEQLATRIKSLGVKDILRNVPPLTVNLLAQIQ